jgi:hypothetical protein
MKKIHVISLALVAIFAFSAVLAASASAETTLLVVWTAKGTEITTEQATTTTGTILLADTKVPLLGEVAVTCEGKLDGFVGANGTDLITEVLNSENIAILPLEGKGLLCETEKNCETDAKSPIELWPLNLPWVTLAYLMENGKILDLILNSTYHLKCLVLGVNAEDECSAAETGLVIENGTGIVLSPNGSITEPLANCTQGGTGSGVNEIVGESKLTLNSGEALQVTE